MNAEVGFLVLILYFYLFLDLYSSFGKLFLGNGGERAKQPWQSKRRLMKHNGTKNLAICATVGACTLEKDKRKIDLHELSFHREISQPHGREFGRMAAMQKSRLWGRG